MTIQLKNGDTFTLNVGDKYDEVFGTKAKRPTDYRIILKSHYNRILKLGKGLYKPREVLKNRRILVETCEQLDFYLFMVGIKLSTTGKILYIPETNLELFCELKS